MSGANTVPVDETSACASLGGCYYEQSMDILGEYEKQNPRPLQQAAPQRQLASEYGFFIRLVIKLSGGKIENIRQASYVLLAAAGVIMVATIFVFLGTSGFFSGAKPLYSTDPLNLPPALR